MRKKGPDWAPDVKPLWLAGSGTRDTPATAVQSSVWQGIARKKKRHGSHQNINKYQEIASEPRLPLVEIAEQVAWTLDSRHWTLPQLGRATPASLCLVRSLMGGLVHSIVDVKAPMSTSQLLELTGLTCLWPRSVI